MVFIVLLSLLDLLVSANGDCSVQLHVDGGASRFEIRGSVVQEPFEVGTLSPLIEAQEVGVTGVLVIESDADCPENVDGLAEVWDSLNVTNRQPLTVYPNEVAGKLTSLGFTLTTVNFTGLELSWTANNFTERAEGGPGAFAANVQVAFLEGSLLRYENTATDALIERNLTTGAMNRLNGVLSVDGPSLKIEFNNVSFRFTELARFRIEGRDNINLVEVDSVLNYTISGAVTASATVGCDVDCGNNGRCVKLHSGRLGCQCACGWTGAACDIASGFCSPFPPAGLPECAGDRTELQGTCACRAGWQGALCDMCTTNDACAEFLGVSEGECVDAFTYDVASALKVYSCEEVSGENVLASFFGQQFQIRCNTTGPSGSSFFGGTVLDGISSFLSGDDDDGDSDDEAEAEQVALDNSPFCEFDFRFDNDEAHAVFCVAWGCTFQDGSNRVQCEGPVECSCGGACSRSINDTVQAIGSMNLECSGEKDCEGCKDDQQLCLISLSGEELEIDLEGTCRARECLDPDGEALVGN